MAGTTPSQPALPGLGDLLSLFGPNNPLVTLVKSMDQFRQTMESLNATAQRVNRLLDEVEEPLRTVMPQITQSADTAARMIATLREPVDRLAPTLTQLAETLSNPLITDLPRRLTETMEVVASLPTALGPLSQMAEMAGGLFGGGRAFVRPLSPSPRAPSAAILPARVTFGLACAGRDAPAKRHPARAATRTARSARATFRRSAAKSAAPNKTAAKKKAAPRKTAAKKGAAKKTATKRTASKKAAPRKTAARKRTATRR